MEVKLAQYTNKGMNKDLSISKSSDEFAYNNENIRITTIGRESLLSVTNEKGSTEILFGNIKKVLAKNLFQYSNKKHVEDKYLFTYKSEYKFNINVDFDTTLKYELMPYGLFVIDNPMTRHEFFTRIVSTFSSKEDNDITYYVWAIQKKDSTDINTYYIINPDNYQDYDKIMHGESLFYRLTQEEVDDMTPQQLSECIKIKNQYYRQLSGYLVGRHNYNDPIFVYDCFNKMYSSNNPINFNKVYEEYTFHLTANKDKDLFEYDLLEDKSILLPDDYEEIDIGLIIIEIGKTPYFDIIETNMDYYNYDYDKSFYYTSDKNAKNKEVLVQEPITGDFIGYCVANNYIVLFVRNNEVDYIYRLERDEDRYKPTLLFLGDLDLSKDNPIETLYFYESEDIQKVYWLDGVHQTRVINIMKEDYINNKNNQFDFCPSIRKTPTVKIKKKFDALGNFHSGVIQYFITYYNKFAAESNIAWSSALQYLSFEDRAGSADEFVSCSFDINISNIDTAFDYIRLYSVKRESLDGPIQASIVSDIKINDRESISIIDVGSNQTSIDPNLLLFISGSNFVAETFAQKDNTLFLGNIKINDNDVDGKLKEYINNNWFTDGNIKESKKIEFNYKCFSEATPVGLYPYQQQINSSSLAFKTFKNGEIYRFAIQYQDDTGIWTQPIWIGDKKCTLHPKRVDKNYQTAVANATFTLSSTELNPNSEYGRLTSKYIAYRLLMAKTSPDTRSVISQGIVCPTIFNYKQRTENKPYSISSYIMRPRNSNVEYKHFYPVSEIFGGRQTILPLRKSDVSKPEDTAPASVWLKLNVTFYFIFGVTTPAAALVPILPVGVPIPAWTYHLTASADMMMKDDNDSYYNIMTMCPAIHKWSLFDIKSAYENLMAAMGTNLLSYRTEVGSGHEILTEAETNTIKTYAVPSGNDWTLESNFWSGAVHILKCSKMVEIGSTEDLYSKYISLLDNNGDISEFDEDTLGLLDNEYYVDESIVTFNSPDIEDNIYRINQSGVNFRLVGIAPITSSYSDFNMRFKDDSVDNNYSGTLCGLPETYNKGNITYDTYTLIKDYLYYGKTFNSNDTLANKNDYYNIYMWHHTGPLFGDINTTIGNEQVKLNVDIIDEKTFSTKRFSLQTQYFNDVKTIPIAKPEVFNEDYVSLKKIAVPKQDGSYYGNYTTSLVPSVVGSDVDRIPHESGDTGYGVIKKTFSPVDISFNSTPHAVLSLCDFSKNKFASNSFYLLPKLASDKDTRDDYLYYTFAPNIESDSSQQYSIGSVDVLGVAYIGYDKTKPLEDKLDDYMNRVFPSGTLDAYYLMVSNSDVNSDLPKIEAIYKVSHKSYISQKYHYYYNEYKNYDNDTFNFVQNDDYPNLQIESNAGSIRKNVFMVDSITGNLKCISNNIDKFTRVQTINFRTEYPYLFIGELYRDIPYSTLYGGYDENAIENITWIPISSITPMQQNITKTEGDTYYQRWDCVKTLPFSTKGVNNVIDITSIMVESHNCLDGRWDKNKTSNDIINLSVDNYNLFNKVYSQSNNLFTYNILDDKYDLDKFKNQILWSKEKSLTEDVDTWTNISQLNSIYLDGEFGGINKLVNFNDNIIAFQDKAIAAINFNNQTQISTEQGLPIEVVNSGKVTGYNYLTKVNGCINKWSITDGVSGLFFIDSLNKSIFRFNKDGLTNLSASLGFADWSKDNISLNKWTINTDAFRTSSDKITHDVYFINKKKCLCYNEDTQTFTSFYTEYANTISMFNLDGKSYYLGKDLKIHEMFTGDYLRNFSVEFNVNPEPLEDKIFTNVEYIADTINNNNLLTSNPFKKLEVKTEYQEGETNLLNNKYPNSATKFRKWGVDVPRDKVNKLDRIRNPWARFKLEGNDKISGMTTLHTLTVKYFK